MRSDGGRPVESGSSLLEDEEALHSGLAVWVLVFPAPVAATLPRLEVADQPPAASSAVDQTSQRVHSRPAVVEPAISCSAFTSYSSDLCHRKVRNKVPKVLT